MNGKEIEEEEEEEEEEVNNDEKYSCVQEVF